MAKNQILFTLLFIFAAVNGKKLSKITSSQTDPFSASTNVLPQFGQNQGWSTFNDKPRILADLNGDGALDIVGFDSNNLVISLATDSGFGTPFTNVAGLAGTGWNFQNFPVTSCDVNGDGLDDLVGFGSAKLFVAYSQKTSFKFAVQIDSDFLYEKGWSTFDRNPRFCYDVDGDGKADLVGFADDGVYVQFSTGTSFQPKTLALSNFGYNDGYTSYDLHPRCLGNVKNIIGGASILAFKNDGVYESTFSGSSFDAPTLVLPGAFGVDSGYTTNTNFPRLCADMNGDGRTDIVGFGSALVSVSYANADGTFGNTETTTQISSGYSSFDANPRLVGRVRTKSLLGSLLGFANDGVYQSDKQTVQISNDVVAAFSDWKQGQDLFGSDDGFRLQVFNQNYQIIEAHQQDSSRTFEMALNQFAALTKKEFIETYLGTNPDDLQADSFLEIQDKVADAGLINQNQNTQSKKNKYNLDVQMKASQNYLPTTNLPASVDWRSKGAVTPVKNQGGCGSCWAFSAVAALESLSFIKGRGLPSFSEQQLVDCSRSYGNYGCNGGLMDNSFRYVRDIGIGLGSPNYPYTATDGTCKASCGYFKISGYNDVPAGNDLQLAAAINQQPVSVAVDASNFQFYSSGVFNFCSNYLNHGILAVGYTSSYWIVKNSWGTGWGENGYIRMARGNTCGILNMASYPIA